MQNPDTGRAEEANGMAEDQRSFGEQSETGKCGYSSWDSDLCHRCQRIGKKLSDQRGAL